MPKIFIARTADKDLRFFKKVSDQLKRNHTEILTYTKLINNSESHSNCLETIKTSNEIELICLFCHGRTNGLLGCTYFSRGLYGSTTRTNFHTHHSDYEHGIFIGPRNIRQLVGKKIFCLSCNSNGLGKLAVNAGVRVFIGFDNIEFGYTHGRLVVDITKYELRKAAFYALDRAIRDNSSFNSLKEELCLALNKSSQELILKYRNHRKAHLYRLSARNLQDIRLGVKVHGNGSLKLID